MAKKISSATIKEIIKENAKENKTLILKTADADIEVVRKPEYMVIGLIILKEWVIVPKKLGQGLGSQDEANHLLNRL